MTTCSKTCAGLAGEAVVPWARRESLVFDAAPLIALSAAGFLPQVPRLGVRAIVAEEVQGEVMDQGRAFGTPEPLLLEQMVREGDIAVRRVRDRRMVARMLENPRLSRADVASLCLALEVHGRLVADDRDLRAAARRALGVSLGGSLHVLGLAVDRRLLTPREAVETAERMIAAGWYCSPSLLKSFTEFILRRP
jgi:predicted nucleic acid-binding protein